MYLQQNKKIDWLFVVDPIRLVWNTYISHSLTDSQTHSLVYTIPDAPTKRYFLQKHNSKMGRKDWSRWKKWVILAKMGHF